MKSALVMSSTVSRHQRMDAGYYLGELESRQACQDVERARINLERAHVRMRNALRRELEAHCRSAGLVARGEVIPLSVAARGPLEYVI